MFLVLILIGLIIWGILSLPATLLGWAAARRKIDPNETRFLQWDDEQRRFVPVSGPVELVPKKMQDEWDLAGWDPDEGVIDVDLEDE